MEARPHSAAPNWKLNTEYWIVNTGYWILETEHRTPNIVLPAQLQIAHRTSWGPDGETNLNSMKDEIIKFSGNWRRLRMRLALIVLESHNGTRIGLDRIGLGWLGLGLVGRRRWAGPDCYDTGQTFTEKCWVGSRASASSTQLENAQELRKKELT